MQYVYQKINKLITEINTDILHKYNLIDKILLSTY